MHKKQQDISQVGSDLRWRVQRSHLYIRPQQRRASWQLNLPSSGFVAISRIGDHILGQFCRYIMDVHGSSHIFCGGEQALKKAWRPNPRLAGPSRWCPAHESVSFSGYAIVTWKSHDSSPMVLTVLTRRKYPFSTATERTLGLVMGCSPVAVASVSSDLHLPLPWLNRNPSLKRCWNQW